MYGETAILMGARAIGAWSYFDAVGSPRLHVLLFAHSFVQPNTEKYQYHR
jgi:hypothetical protein